MNLCPKAEAKIFGEPGFMWLNEIWEFFVYIVYYLDVLPLL